MDRLAKYGLIGALATLTGALAPACSSDADDKNNQPLDDGGTGGASTGGRSNGGSGNGGASAGASSAGGSSAGGSSAGGSSAGGRGAGGSSAGGAAPVDGGGGEGGTPPVACDLSGTGKTKEAIPNPVATSMTLTADKVWTLSDITHVSAGATLTIEPCTRIEGTKSPIGVLVVTKGAKIMAEGTDADHPILFTSQQAAGSRAAGDWGGVILLGNAVTNDGDALIEGLADVSENHYGGSDDADDSGSMKYVRIEFAGFELAPNVEVNGLTMGGVGSATDLSHIEVSNGLDDCFEFFGGTVSADHLICNGDGDDMFDTDRGYRGTLEYLFGRKFANPSGDPNGFEWDNNNGNNEATPLSHPTARHATLCGYGIDVGVTTYGMVLRRGVTAAIEDTIAVGFTHGVDTRNNVGTTTSPTVTITGSTFAALLGTLAPDETTVPADDDDTGFDEAAWFAADTTNSTTAPAFTVEDCNPAAGGPPTAAFFDAAVGANSGGNWMTGMWVDWAAD